MPAQAASELALVQVGHVDVDPAALTVAGIALEDLLVAYPNLDVHAPAEVLDLLPEGGWRRVHSRPSRADLGGQEVHAAPHRERPGTWAMISLSERDGIWTLSADPGPIPAFLGRPARRAGLRFAWPEALIAPAGTTPDLSIELRNVSDEVWINQPDDSAHVHGWLHGADGQRLPASPWIGYGHGASIPALQPGEAASLPVTLATPDVDLLSPGEYAIEAVLVALNLRSAPGSLRLV